MDQLKIDFQLKALYPTIQPGDSGVINDVRYTYKGSDVVYDQIEQLKKTNPELLDVEVCSRMLADPMGYRAPRFVLDPGVSAALSGQTDKALSGALGVAMGAAIARGDLDVAFATGAIGGLTKNAALGAAAGAALEGGVAGAVAGGVIGNALKGPLGPVLGGALGGAIGSELGKLAADFVPPGLDGPIEAVKSAIKGITNQLPFKTSGAADVVNKAIQIKALMNLGLKGPAALIFSAINSNLLSDIPGLGDIAKAVNLQSQVAALAGLASNPIAFAAQAALMKAQFPMINVNALAANMIAGAAIGALGGKGFNIKSMVPNMALAGGLLALKALPGISPFKNAVPPVFTPRPPAPKKPIEVRNLFAEAGAASTMNTLNKPLSQFMGIMATVSAPVNQVADTAAKTSLGTQKLVGTANTTNWGSGGYGRNNELDKLEKKRMEMTAKIEKQTSELDSMVDYSELTSMSYPELIKKYPTIKPTMTVGQALYEIEKAKKAANTATRTV